MSRNQEELSIRMKYRKKSAQELQAIIDGDYNDLEKKIASEQLAKITGNSQTPVQTQEPEPEPQPDKPETSTEEPKPVPKKKKNGEPLLSPEEEERLSEAEAEFNKRQAARKTPSKSGMTEKKTKVAKKEEKSLRETKRQTLDASDEVEGLKVGSKVKVDGDETEYTVTKLYRSSDGKEKCLISAGDGKPMKKRVTSLKLV